MKARKLVGGLIAVIGVAAAVSVAEGNAHETLVRAIGVAMFIIGTFTAKAFDFQNEKS